MKSNPFNFGQLTCLLVIPEINLTGFQPSSRFLVFILLIGILFSQCKGRDALPPGDPDNGGLFLPDGFEAVVVVDSVGRARHLAVSEQGDIYVKLRTPKTKGIIALRDADKDGKADSIVLFGDYIDEGNYGTAMRIYNDHLYFSTAGVVYRTKLIPGKLVPEGEVEVVLIDDYENAPMGHEHIAKPLAFDNEGHMYVPFGAPGDVCQELNRRPGAPGLDPCPELERHGGIWQFDANTLNQTQDDGKRYATGIRSVVAMDWNHVDNHLYVLQHGRDNMNRFDPEIFSSYQSAIFPSEEFFRVEEGSDFGWPYYYYDFIQEKKLLNPEYGGDGKIPGKGAEYGQPIIGFPGHWAPNDLYFYEGDQFPDRYKNGAFIAFHGSTIRAPYPQSGYFVGFVPFKNGAPSGPWEVFADGFAGVDTIINTRDAKARPMGISMGPDGSLYFSESVKGKIWRIMYKGDRDEFGEGQLAQMEIRKNTQPNIRHPHEIEDNLEKDKLTAGAQLYNLYCASCHLRDGKGDGGRFPSLVNTEWVIGDKRKLIDVVLYGLEGPITVNEQPFNGIMPANNFLDNEEVASVLTYIRKSFGNNASSIYAEEVADVRNDANTK